MTGQGPLGSEAWKETPFKHAQGERVYTMSRHKDSQAAEPVSRPKGNGVEKSIMEAVQKSIAARAKSSDGRKED